jgi:hypothetical protein
MADVYEHGRADGDHRWGIAEVFVIAQTALPSILYLPGTQAFRLPLRIGAFLISTALLAYWFFTTTQRERREKHPSVAWALAALAYVALMAFHPSTSSMTVAVAQFGLYLSVLAPLFWAPWLVRSPIQLRRLMAILLVCNGINSIVGVLQVYDPQRFLPAEFSRLITSSSAGLGPVTYRGPNGELIVRPPGLFDTPGAVAGPGLYAALLGLVFAATRFKIWQRALSVLLALSGFAAIFLSQVRVSAVVAVGSTVVYALVVAYQRRRGTAAAFAGVAVASLIGALGLAVALGGSSISTRLSTLFTTDPVRVYSTARGVQLAVAFTDTLFQFPFGAGLGRWGMVTLYFGSPTLDAPSLWAEIQLAGWMIDGGLILLALYCAALIAAALFEFRVATRDPDPLLRASAAAVFAANLGTLALIFTFTPFVTQAGLQYWFLAGALFGVVRGTRAAEAARAVEVAAPA